MATVTELLDQLADGTLTVQQVADDFRKRTWATLPEPNPQAQWGVTDDDAPDPDSWAAVSTDSRLTPQQYRVLVEAYADAISKKS